MPIGLEIFLTNHPQNTMNIKILIPLTTIALLFAACNKQPEPKGPSKEVAKATAKATPKAVVPTILFRTNVKSSEMFTVSRNGQIATIDILVDLSACKRVSIKRNATGISKDQILVGDLPPKRRQLTDTLPSPDAYYYWLVVEPPTGRHRTFGPIRIDPDTERKGTYTSVEETYPWQAVRTQTRAIISWDFPKTKYSRISIVRNTSVKLNGRREIYATKEGVGTFTDTLPDSNADYWYWLVIKIKNKNIIYQGPIKAEFSTQ